MTVCWCGDHAMGAGGWQCRRRGMGVVRRPSYHGPRRRPGGMGAWRAQGRAMVMSHPRARACAWWEVVRGVGVSFLVRPPWGLFARPAVDRIISRHRPVAVLLAEVRVMAPPGALLARLVSCPHMWKDGPSCYAQSIRRN
jgi:hypothetical protein